MIRIGIVITSLALLLGAAFYVGTRWDDADKERDKASTLERARNAEISKGDPTADDAWVRDFLDSLPAR